MKPKDLKAYHAYYVMAVLFLATCFFTGDFVFFPVACAFLAIGVAGSLKDKGKLVLPDSKDSKKD